MYLSNTCAFFTNWSIIFILSFNFYIIFLFLYTAPPLILMKTKTVRRSGNNFSLSVDFISLTYVPEVHWFRIMEGQTGKTTVNNEINRISYAIVKDNITFSIPSYMYVNSWYDKLFYRIYNNYMNIKKCIDFITIKKGLRTWK